MEPRRPILAQARRSRTADPALSTPPAPAASATAGSAPAGETSDTPAGAADDRWSLLLQIASLAAAGAAASEIFIAVDRAFAYLAGAEASVLIRFETIDTLAVVAGSGATAAADQSRARPPDSGILRRLRAVDRPARWDGITLDEELRSITGFPLGTRIVLGLPIRIGERIWGIQLLASVRVDIFPKDADKPLAEFAGLASPMLVWAQVSSDLRQVESEQTEERRAAARSRDELSALVGAQSALQRVTALIAQGVSQDVLFDSVTAEAADLVQGCTTLLRVDTPKCCTVVGSRGSQASIGTRITDGAMMNLVAKIRRTRRPARVADHTINDDTINTSDPRGGRSIVGVPVLVGNEIWGVLGCTTGERQLHLDTERQLEQFAVLVAVALANVAVKGQLRAFAGEQAALRRVADLAAREAPTDEVMRAVAHQTARLSGVEFTSLLRFEEDGSSTIVSLAGAPSGIAVGMSASLAGDGAIPRVWRTGRPARVDDLSRAEGGWAAVVAERGYSSTVAVPIFIRGNLWGVLVVVGADGPFPTDTEDHLVNFAELAGSGISAIQARVELRAVADEQTALRRLAELVARGAPLEQVLAATPQGASALMGGMAAALMRYEGDEDALIIAVSNSPAPVGLRVPLTADTGTGIVHRTGRAHRTDDFAETSLADVAVRLGVVAAVTVPVVVEGSVWGTLSISTVGPPIPPGTEARLAQFAELAAAAIAAAQNKNALLASRRRVLVTADETRRRVQRDVHDGAQQRLVHTIINLKLARDALEANDSQVRFLLAEGLRNAERANQELRDLVHGILPAALTLGGLRQGIESLADDLAVPATIRFEAPRLPSKIETTAYFVVAESLTNIVKHAGARHVNIDVFLAEDALVIDIVDDGSGGAEAADGGGLMGLQDRVQAGDGVLIICSPPGGGTHVRARMPITDICL